MGIEVVGDPDRVGQQYGFNVVGRVDIDAADQLQEFATLRSQVSRLGSDCLAEEVQRHVEFSRI